MKKTIFLVFLLTLSLVSSAPAVPIQFDAETITGKDWLSLSRLEKGVFIFNAVQALKAYGVPLNKTPGKYTSWMDKEVTRDPRALDIKATNILAVVIYQREPQCRQALDQLRI